MSRFYVPGESIKDGKIVISGKEAHHIIDVMRLRVSDSVVTFDGTGREYAGVITEVRRSSLVVEIKEVRQGVCENNSLITLIQAIPKKERMDHIVEKATELGVARIIPVVTERTIVKWDEPKRAGNTERWRKIALAAAKQCGRRDIPEIMQIEKLLNCFGILETGGLRLMAALCDDAVPLKEAIKGPGSRKVAVAIGPEGDFTQTEMKEARAAGFKVVSLGPRVLKSDTAGLYVISAVNYEFQNV